MQIPCQTFIIFLVLVKTSVFNVLVTNWTNTNPWDVFSMDRTYIKKILNRPCPEFPGLACLAGVIIQFERIQKTCWPVRENIVEKLSGNLLIEW